MSDRHIAPNRYSRYEGGFVTVTRCQGCKIIASRIDQSSLDPCRQCGGRIEQCEKAARWHGPESIGHLWWKILIKPGFWEFSK